MFTELKNTGIRDKHQNFIHDKDLLLHKCPKGICFFEVDMDSDIVYLISKIDDREIVCVLNEEVGKDLEIVDIGMN